MKIAVDYSEKYDLETINIVTATYSNEYIIQVIFSDGIEKWIDLKPFLSKSQHPSITKYLDLNNFKNFSIIDGNLNWNDYDMIFPVWDLYKGKIN